jgi:hypothetical protein
MTRLLAVALTASLAATAATKDCAGTSKAPPAASPTATAVPTAAPSPPPAPTEAPDLFVSVVRPVLKAHCAPCHEPGGKMYGRLPFDNPRVLASHSAGALRRLKGEDREAFERWLATLNPEEATPKN